MKIPKVIKFIAVVVTTSVPITIAMIMEKYHFLNGYFHIDLNLNFDDECEIRYKKSEFNSTAGNFSFLYECAI